VPQPLQPPEFFLDRSLGRRVAEGLTAYGWTIHRVAEHFPDDAQFVPDEVWLAYGLERGWSPLCKDGRIRGRQVEREPLERFQAVLFYLDNQRLLVDEMVWRFQRSRDSIYRAVRRGPATYAVGTGGIKRTWP
jgi:PIN domain-containing protein